MTAKKNTTATASRGTDGKPKAKRGKAPTSGPAVRDKSSKRTLTYRVPAPDAEQPHRRVAALGSEYYTFARRALSHMREAASHAKRLARITASDNELTRYAAWSAEDVNLLMALCTVARLAAQTVDSLIPSEGPESLAVGCEWHDGWRDADRRA